MEARIEGRGLVPGSCALAERLAFWSPSEQVMGYRSMERIFPSRIIKAGGRVLALPPAPEGLDLVFQFQNRPYTVDDFVSVSRVSGLLVLRNGKILLERYGLGRRSEDLWTSFSIAKSVTSTLLAAALRDGAIRSIEDPVTRYVPELRGGVYEGVTLRHMLLMCSGAHWVENYDDPQSDFNRHGTGTGPAFYKAMSQLGRDAQPGSRYRYSTGESNLIGAAVMNATGKSLSAYFSEKIWEPFGMEKDGLWILSPEGLETGGMCFSARLRDFGRFGVFMLGGGRVDGRSVLPEGWLPEATCTQVESEFGSGYGYHWWIKPKDAFQAMGIMGQSLVVDPTRSLVIVIQSAWATHGSPADYQLQSAFIEAVQTVVGEAGTPAAGG